MNVQIESCEIRTLTRLKRVAKALKKETGCTHTEALEAVARAAGYSNYMHARGSLGE